MTQPKVSIIIPVYNVEKYLNRCLDSLQHQTLTDIEILLVDDCSTDSSLQLCQQAAEQDPRIRVIHKENAGAGMARNTALEVATGEYVGFVDSDDFVDLDMFRILYDKAQAYDADLVLSGVVYEGGVLFGNEDAHIHKAYFDTDTTFADAEALRRLRYGIVGALPGEAEDSQYGMSVWKNLFRRDIIRQHGLTFRSEREILSEDSLFMVDYIACIRSAVGIPHALYHYCRNGDSVSKGYKADRLDKTLRFVEEVEQRFAQDADPSAYAVYLHRFWQAMCRVQCSQEILHATQNHIPYATLKQRLRMVCTHPRTVAALKAYPIGTLPLKQRIFAYGLKYRAYALLKLLVTLRSQ